MLSWGFRSRFGSRSRRLVRGGPLSHVLTFCPETWRSTPLAVDRALHDGYGGCDVLLRRVAVPRLLRPLSCSCRATCPPCTWRPRLSHSFRDTLRRSWWTLVTVCPSTKVTLCVAPSFVWLDVIFQSVPWWTSLSEGTRSVPPPRGRLLGMWKRIRATLAWIATQCSNRLRHLTRRRRTCSKTETSSLSALDVSNALILYQPGFIYREAYGIHDTSFQNVMKCDVDTRKDLCNNVVLASDTTIFQGIVEHMTNKLTALAPSTMRSRWSLRFGVHWRIYLVCELPDGTSSLSALNGSITWKCCSSQISLVKEPVESTTLLSRATWNSTFTSARSCTLMSCCQVALPCV